MTLLDAARALVQDQSPYDYEFGECLFCPNSPVPLNAPPPGQTEWGDPPRGKVLESGRIYYPRWNSVQGEPHVEGCPWGALLTAIDEQPE